MQLITEAFYVLSNALLIPVLVVLLVSLIRTLVCSGRVLQEFLTRQQQRDATILLEQSLLQNSETLPKMGQSGELQPLVGQLLDVSSDLPRISYLTEKSELQWRRQLESLRGLVKLGPGLGLMGTLIPLGPALVGLAVGDIQTMSNNLVIAFSTTVIGLFVGLVAGFLVSVKKHWFQVDSALIHLLVERVTLRQAEGRPLAVEEADSQTSYGTLPPASDAQAQTTNVEEVTHA